jgi:hypothetical protein
VYDEMPALRSNSQEGEAPGSVRVRILWLEIDTHDCQQVERLILEQAAWLRELAGKPVVNKTCTGNTVAHLAISSEELLRSLTWNRKSKSQHWPAISACLVVS